MALAHTNLAREFRIDPRNTLPENEFSFGFSLKPCVIPDIEKNIPQKSVWAHIRNRSRTDSAAVSTVPRVMRKTEIYPSLYNLRGSRVHYKGPGK